MAIEIEQPFGDDANDLPLEDYIANLETTLEDFLPGRSASSSERDCSLRLDTLASDTKNAPQTDSGAFPCHDAASPTRVKSMVTSTIKRVDYEYEQSPVS